MTEDPNVLRNQLAIARKEIQNLRQQLVALSHVHRKEVANIYQKIEDWQCSACRRRQENSHEIPMVPNSNASETNPYDLQLQYIGRVRTHFPEKRGTPRQPAVGDSTIAKLVLSNEVFTNPNHAVEGLQEFSHMWILFHFHKNNNEHTRAKVAPPRLNGARTGVFATRSPNRPCPIGLSLVKIDKVIGNTVYFSGVDMIDKTPVLDIKPFIPHYDSPSEFTFHNPLPDRILLNCDEGPVPSNLVDSSQTSSVNVLDNTEDQLSTRVMDGEENERHNEILGGLSPNSSQPEETFYARSNSRIGEREAPDGEEEEVTATAPGAQALPIARQSVNHVRVPSWIEQSPVPRLTVLFKDRALGQLSQLGSEGDQKKNTITSVLKEDPRSVYLRERWGSHCYVFRIAELFVSCKFNDANQTVTVYQVFQNDGPPLENDE